MMKLFGEDWVAIGRAMMMQPYSCHDHYKRYMQFSKAPWTSAEERKLREFVGELGTRWVLIAEKLGTKRSGGDVRNRWHKIKDLTPPIIAPPLIIAPPAQLDDYAFPSDDPFED
jgi:hypothetical protein